MKQTWKLEDSDVCNEFLKKALYDYAVGAQNRLRKWQEHMHVYQGHVDTFADCPVCFPKYTKWQLAWFKVKYWWYDHRPHFHFGPCDSGDEH